MLSNARNVSETDPDLMLSHQQTLFDLYKLLLTASRLAVKTVPGMTYNVSSGAIKSTKR